MPELVTDRSGEPLPRMPAAAARVRARGAGLAADALRGAIARDPSLGTRYDVIQMRTFLRDMESHIVQLATALESGQVVPMTMYVDTIVPVFRRRKVPLEDLATMLLGMRDAVRLALPAADGDAVAVVVGAALRHLERPRHLPGDRPGNPILRFLWKGAGILD